MSNWPTNSEVLAGIARTSFYNGLMAAEKDLVYPKICMMIDQADLTVTYTSFGGVPEPRQLSGSVASTGERQGKGMKDYKLSGTVVEWEDTVLVPRAVIETNPSEIPRRMQQMAQKAQIFMDRRLVGTTLAASTVGYDGVQLISDSHNETGSNQDNNWSTAVTGISATHPTSAEFEMLLDVNIKDLKSFQDDQGTPVNAGVSSFKIICPLEYEFHLKNLTSSAVGASIQSFDASGATGRFRGMFEVLGTPFLSTADRYYIVANNNGSAPVALLKNKDWEFKTNIGTDSDLWNLGQMAAFYAYARFEFVPWDWKTIGLQVVT